MKVRFDVWGGKRLMDHVARRHYDLADQPAITASLFEELGAGFLVNVRALQPDEGWGPDVDFDYRQAGHA